LPPYPFGLSMCSTCACIHRQQCACIAPGRVNGTHGQVHAEPLLGDFELGGRVAVRLCVTGRVLRVVRTGEREEGAHEEAERHAEVEDRLQRKLLQAGDIDRLRA
jgi:hypothetical protein